MDLRNVRKLLVENLSPQIKTTDAGWLKQFHTILIQMTSLREHTQKQNITCQGWNFVPRGNFLRRIQKLHQIQNLSNSWIPILDFWNSKLDCKNRKLKLSNCSKIEFDAIFEFYAKNTLRGSNFIKVRLVVVLLQTVSKKSCYLKSRKTTFLKTGFKKIYGTHILLALYEVNKSD